MTAGQHPDGFRSFLRSIPDEIARREEDGYPVIVEMPPTLPPHAQRLLATLGCLIRFKEDAAMPHFPPPVPIAPIVLPPRPPAPRRRAPEIAERLLMALADDRDHLGRELADTIGVRRDSAVHELRHLVNSGLVEKPRRGVYRLPRERETVGPSRAAVAARVDDALADANLDDPLAAAAREWADLGGAWTSRNLEPFELD